MPVSLSEEDLSKVLERAPPREVPDSLLELTRLRVRQAVRAVLIIYAVPAAVILTIGLLKLDAGMLAGLIAETVMFLGGLCALTAWFFARDLSLGRSLLREGQHRMVDVMEIGTSDRGQHTLGVSFVADGKQVRLRFRTDLDAREAAAFEGRQVHLLHAPGVPTRAAIVLPERGLIATR